MESDLLKLMSQLGFIAVVIWLLAALTGHKRQARIGSSGDRRRRRRRRSKGIIRHTGGVSPYCTQLATAPAPLSVPGL